MKQNMVALEARVVTIEETLGTINQRLDEQSRRGEESMQRMMERMDQLSDLINNLAGRQQQVMSARDAHGSQQELFSSDEEEGKSFVASPRQNPMKDWLKFNIQAFSGTDPDYQWAQFISKFNTCCVFNKVPELSKTSILGFYLCGLPKTYFDELVGTDKNVSFPDLVKNLQAKLSASRGNDQTAIEITSIKQKNDESVKSYYDRFQRILALGGTPPDNQFVNLHFRLGLRPDIRDTIMSKGDLTLDEIVKIAAAIEVGKKAVSTLSAGNAVNAYEVPPQNGRFAGKSNNHRAAFNCPAEGKNKNKRGAVVCFYCRKKGHVEKECRAKQNNANASQLRGGTQASCSYIPPWPPNMYYPMYPPAPPYQGSPNSVNAS